MGFSLSKIVKKCFCSKPVCATVNDVVALDRVVWHAPHHSPLGGEGAAANSHLANAAGDVVDLDNVVLRGNRHNSGGDNL